MQRSCVFVQSGVDSAVVCETIKAFVDPANDIVMLFSGDGDLAPVFETCNHTLRWMMNKAPLQLCCTKSSVSSQFGEGDLLAGQPPIYLDQCLPKFFSTSKKPPSQIPPVAATIVAPIVRVNALFMKALLAARPPQAWLDIQCAPSQMPTGMEANVFPTAKGFQIRGLPNVSAANSLKQSIAHTFPNANVRVSNVTAIGVSFKDRLMLDKLNPVPDAVAVHEGGPHLALYVEEVASDRGAQSTLAAERRTPRWWRLGASCHRQRLSRCCNPKAP